MKRKTISLLFIVFVSSILSAFPVNACTPPFFGKTSLEVWKVIDTIVEGCGDKVTITGTIYIQNDNTNKAQIMWVKDSVEGKAKKQPWDDIWGPYTLRSSFTIEPGELYELPFSITFLKGDYKAYRNVVKVCLSDIHRGHYFKYFTHRVSFEV